jgi:predicted nucleotidyltransferase component of viral defense system
MKLHENKQDFQNAIQATSESLGIRDIFVEKDYWVTYILKQLSESKFKDEVVFKGGTSLSKAFDIISRFSEDVDLVIIGKNDLSGNQIKTKIKKIEEALIIYPLEEDVGFKSSKGSKFRKTGYKYPRVLGDYVFGHAEESLILEINAFANPYPDELREIESYIAKFFRETNESYITEYELESFEVKVIGIKRTLVEKILSLARLSISDNGTYDELKGKVRHFYDIHKLMLESEISDFLLTKDFEETINMAIEDDLSNPEFRDSWENTKLKEVRLFSDMENVFKNITDIYKNDFSSLLYDGEGVELSDIKKSFDALLEVIPNIEILK